MTEREPYVPKPLQPGEKRCPSTTEGGKGYRTTRQLQCQKQEGHEGQCAYHRQGGQGGSMQWWWGANPRPVEFIDDLSYSNLRGEVWRLRHLLDAHYIEWRDGVVKPGH